MSRDALRLFAAASLATMVACAPDEYGRPFDASQVANLKPGVSTYGDAVGLLGQPVTQRTQSNGVTTVVWSHSVLRAPASSNKVVMTFRRDGVLDNVTAQTTSLPSR